jgi:hypothetical protein
LGENPFEGGNLQSTDGGMRLRFAILIAMGIISPVYTESGEWDDFILGEHNEITTETPTMS